jgi:uncharacterized membrane protein YozB (DUF420 family)
MDPGLAIVVATAVGAAIYLALAVSNFRHKRIGLAAARLFAAVLFAGVSLFLAVQMRLF